MKVAQYSAVKYLVSNNWIMTNESNKLLKIYNTVFLVLQFVAREFEKELPVSSAQIDEI